MFGSQQLLLWMVVVVLICHMVFYSNLLICPFSVAPSWLNIVCLCWLVANILFSMNWDRTVGYVYQKGMVSLRIDYLPANICVPP